jgi:hypothetical protein
MQVTLDLTPEQVAALSRAFSSPRFASQQELLAELLPLMAETWIGWVSGDKRYTSLTEQYTDWIDQVYSRVLPPEEAPSAERIFNSFNLPFGQAQYIARVLNSRALAHWREYAVEQLKEKLAGKKAAAQEMIAHQAGDQTIEILLYRPAFQELDLAIEALFQQNAAGIDLPRVNSTHNLFAVRLTARTLMAVCAYFNL